MDGTRQRVVIYQRPAQHCGGRGCAKCLLIFFTIMCLLVGFIVTMVGHLAEPFWGPEDDWCEFCREDRLTTERNLKNCRTVGPIFLAIGGVLFCVSIYYCRVQNKRNAGQVITGAANTQMGSTSQAVTGTIPASHYPASTYGHQQPYGQMPAYQPGAYPNNPPQPPAGSYPNNPPQPPAGSYPPYPTGHVYPPQTQHPYPPQSGQGYPPYQTDMAPPPSYESAMNQSASPSAPTLEKVG